MAVHPDNHYLSTYAALRLWGYNGNITEGEKEMNKTFSTLLCLVTAVSLATTASAKNEKKNNHHFELKNSFGTVTSLK